MGVIHHLQHANYLNLRLIHTLVLTTSIEEKMASMTTKSHLIMYMRKKDLFFGAESFVFQFAIQKFKD
jgi:hypothetical protein